MSKLIKLSLFGILLLLTACSTIESLLGTPIIPAGETSTSQTSQGGYAVLEFDGSNESYQIDLQLTDIDTNRGLNNINVNSVALDTGVFIWTEDPNENYFPSTAYVSFDELKTSRNELEPQLAVTTLAMGAVAVISVGLSIYELYSDPPGVREVLEDTGAIKTCVEGDFNDVLATIGIVTGINTLTGVVRVLSAPSNIRGVTAINLQFTKVNLKKEASILFFEETMSKVVGFLDTDHKVYCWYKTHNNEVIPIIDITVTREVTEFDIVKLEALAFYPVIRDREDIITGNNIQWRGNPSFPITIKTTPVVCYPGWTCVNHITGITKKQNPVFQIFGCWGGPPSSKSGYMTFQTILEDSSGLQTPPVNYTFRCGERP